jgi:uncharacterized delta-60 repeat protein
MKRHRYVLRRAVCATAFYALASACFANAGNTDLAFGDRGMYVHGVLERTIHTRQVLALGNGKIVAGGGIGAFSSSSGWYPGASFLLSDAGRLERLLGGMNGLRSLALRDLDGRNAHTVADRPGCGGPAPCVNSWDRSPLFFSGGGSGDTVVDFHAGSPAILSDGRVVSLGLTYLTFGLSSHLPPEVRELLVPPRFDVVALNIVGRRDPAVEARFLAQMTRCIAGTGVSLDKTVPAVAVMPDDRIVFAFGPCVLRLHPDGTPDPTFGTSGMSTIDNGGLHVTRLLVMPDGRVLTFHRLADNSTFRVTRRLANGQPDTSFGPGGAIAALPLPFAPANGMDVPNSPPNALGLPAVDPRGRLLFAGSLPDSPRQYLARFDADMNLDRSFGDPATGLAPLGDAERGVFLPYSVAFDAQERIVLGGQLQARQVNGFPLSASEAVTRLLPDDDVMVTLVEYYHAPRDHYFMTWSASEIAALDGSGGGAGGWKRTGSTFRAYFGAKPGTSPVCRWYLPPGYGDSHFFGRDQKECDEVAEKFPQFILEDARFFHTVLPVAGVCPTGTTPVYRLFSNRPDSNHRYTTDRTVRDEMVAKGWVPEGDGPDGVAICAP